MNLITGESNMFRENIFQNAYTFSSNLCSGISYSTKYFFLTLVNCIHVVEYPCSMTITDNCSFNIMIGHCK